MTFNPTPKPAPRTKKPSQPVKRSAIKPSGTRLNPVNQKRKASAFARAYHSKERVAFVKALPCVVCHQTPSDNAHIENGGMGRKADYTTIVPLCRTHHRRLHILGRATFEASYGVALGLWTTHTELSWFRWGKSAYSGTNG